MTEECSRIHFLGESILQPLYRATRSDVVVCGACNITCFADTATTAVVPAGSGQCQCAGASGGGCLYQERFGEFAAESRKQTEREMLRRAALALTSETTRELLENVNAIASMEALRSLRASSSVYVLSWPLGLDSLVRRQPPTHCDKTERTANGYHAIADAIDKKLDAFRVIDTLQPPDLFRQLVNSRREVGSKVERCVYLAGILHGLGYQTRLMVQPSPMRTLYVPPREAWVEWHCSQCQEWIRHGAPAAQDSTLTVAITPGGCITDETRAGDAASGTYDREAVSVHLGTLTLQHYKASPTQRDKLEARPTVRKMLLDNLSEWDTIAANHFRMWTAPLDGDIKNLFVSTNAAIANSTVDNDSEIPLRSYRGEVDHVVHVLQWARDGQGAADLMDGLLLLGRVLGQWPQDHLAVALRFLTEATKALCVRVPSSVADHLAVLGEWQRLRILASHPTPLKIKTVCIRFVEEVCVACVDSVAFLAVIPELVEIIYAAATSIVGKKALTTRYGIYSALFAITELLSIAEGAVQEDETRVMQIAKIRNQIIDVVAVCATDAHRTVEALQSFCQLLDALSVGGHGRYVQWERLRHPLTELNSYAPLPAVEAVLDALDLMQPAA